MSIEMYKIGLSEAWKNLLSGKVGNAHPTLRAMPTALLEADRGSS